tara:strand:+ start:184130 stop:185095 length:966 start_codon:yes stop_codon:yes gene_type:complete
MADVKTIVNDANSALLAAVRLTSPGMGKKLNVMMQVADTAKSAATALNRSLEQHVSRKDPQLLNPNKRIEDIMKQQNQWGVSRVPEKYRNKIYKRLLWQKLSPLIHREKKTEMQQYQHTVVAAKIYTSYFISLSSAWQAALSKLSAQRDAEEAISDDPEFDATNSSIADELNVKPSGISEQATKNNSKKLQMKPSGVLSDEEFAQFVNKHNPKVEAVRNAILDHKDAIHTYLVDADPRIFSKISAGNQSLTNAAQLCLSLAYEANSAKDGGTFIAAKATAVYIDTIAKVLDSSVRDMKRRHRETERRTKELESVDFDEEIG